MDTGEFQLVPREVIQPVPVPLFVFSPPVRLERNLWQSVSQSVGSNSVMLPNKGART